MRRTIDILAVLIAVLFGAVGCATPHKSDSATLQGTWQGREAGDNPGGPCYLVISGNNLDFRGANADEWYKGTFTLREDTNPRQLVGIVTECGAPDYVGKTAYVIYRIEGDILTLAGNEPGNPEVPFGFDAPHARRFEFKRKGT